MRKTRHLIIMHFDSKNRGSVMERSLGAGKEPVGSRKPSSYKVAVPRAGR